MENKFLKVMNNTTYTENGALTNKSTLDPVVDFFFHSGALRQMDEESIVDLFNKSFEKDKNTTLKLLFYTRDARGGQGERRTFRIILEWLATHEWSWFVKNLDLVAEYGRYDDFANVLLSKDVNNEVKNIVLNYLSVQYYKDLQNITSGNISLLGKWLWSENASSVTTKKLAKIVLKSKLFGTPKEYRKNLTKLRQAIKIVETKLTQKKYKEIKYEQVPSLAMTKYREAFRKHDDERFSQYLEQVSKGEKKINASVLYPYDIVRAYGAYCSSKVKNDVLEEQWKALPDYVPAFNGLVVADTSGSMNGLPLDVSISLAIYIAERNKSEVWKNYTIPFSHKARFVEIKGETLNKKINEVFTGDCSNTNLQSVFDLILSRAVGANVPQEDMPKSLIVISDMEFDSGYNNYNSFGWEKTNYEIIKEKYTKAGYELPQLIWWNVADRQIQTPVTIDDNGNLLVSGCSPVIMKFVMANDTQILIDDIINQERYKNISY